MTHNNKFSFMLLIASDLALGQSSAEFVVLLDKTVQLVTGYVKIVSELAC